MVNPAILIILAVNLSSTPAPDPVAWPSGPVPPVPYYELWDNPLNQTAQQMVALCSMMEKEIDFSCDFSYTPDYSLRR